MINTRKVNFTIESREVDPSNQKAEKKVEHDIKCHIGNQQLGLLQFTEYVDALGCNIDTSLPERHMTILYFDWIEVPNEYRNLGIGQMLYKKFGEIYSAKFSGMTVARKFDNPVAEYTLKKAILLGYMPQSAYNEKYTSRNIPKFYADPQIIKELENKLPKGHTIG